MQDNDVVLWGIHGGRTGDADTLFLTQSVVAVGWTKAGNLGQLKADREAFKKAVASAFPDEKPGAIPNYAGQLYRFVHEVKAGDLVVYPSNWQQVGGTFIEEFVAVKRTRMCGRRVLDGVIITDGEYRITKQSEVALDGKYIIVVQTKASRLGMYLMGQAFFSAQLVQRFNPRSVVSVALCRQDDAVLRPLFKQYPHMKVVVCHLETASLADF